MKTQHKSALRRSIAKAGSQVALARALGVGPRTVRRWVAGDASPTGLSLVALLMYAGGKIEKAKQFTM